VRIDHVIVAAGDLDAAVARLEGEHGLRASGGGRHEGLGTHNRVVPLGGGYLEILAVVDPREAARSALGRALAAGIARAGESGLMGWAVAVDDVGPVAERLRTPVNTIARQGLSARLTGVPEALATPFLPFFIARDAGTEDPGSGGAAGIQWIEVAGDPDRLHEWLGGARLPVRVVEGAPAVRAVGFGGRVLRTPSSSR
jgi:hypothetical protein